MTAFFGCVTCLLSECPVALFGIASFVLRTTMYTNTPSMYLDPTRQIPRRAASSSERLSPSGLGLNLPLPVPPYLRETFAAENDIGRAGSPALSTVSNPFQQYNEPNGAYISDGSDSSGRHLDVSYERRRSDQLDAYSRTRDFLTHRTVRSFSFRCLPF